MLAWVIVRRGHDRWAYYIPAQGPCWKGEVGFSLWFVNMCIGWQRKGDASHELDAALES